MFGKHDINMVIIAYEVRHIIIRRTSVLIGLIYTPKLQLTIYIYLYVQVYTYSYNFKYI